MPFAKTPLHIWSVINSLITCKNLNRIAIWFYELGDVVWDDDGGDGDWIVLWMWGDKPII